MRKIKRWIIVPVFLCVSGCGLSSHKHQFVSPTVYYQKWQQARAIKNESRARAIGEAIIDGYSEDHCEILPLYKNWQNSIKSYVPVHLRDEIGGFNYSPSLNGKKLNQIQDWANTKLLEAKEKGPDGRTVIVYVDGHTERQ